MSEPIRAESAIIGTKNMPELREIAEWSEDYIAELPRGEYDWIDYKRSPYLTLDSKCLDSLSKYASAFSNFEGGYLVVGVREPDSSSGPTVDSGGVSLSLKKDLKSWLEDKIPNLTNPPLSRLGVATITRQSDGSDISPDHAVIVLRFYPSVSAPHQAHDSKFYTRLGSKLSPLGTRAILDIAQRKRHPVLRTSIHLNINHPNNYNLHWRLHNESDVLVRHFGVKIRAPFSVAGHNIRFIGATLDENKDGEHYYTLTTNNGGRAPLFPRSSVAQPFKLELKTPSIIHPVRTIGEIVVTTYADSMPCIEERFPVDEVLNEKSNS